jgi:transcriptional regulator with XRE-family HTH domain
VDAARRNGEAHIVRHEPLLKRRFGQAVRELRKEKNLSQEGLGLESELDRSYVGGIERGERNPTLNVIFGLAAGLDVAVSTLFERFDELKERDADTPG